MTAGLTGSGGVLTRTLRRVEELPALGRVQAPFDGLGCRGVEAHVLVHGGVEDMVVPGRREHLGVPGDPVRSRQQLQQPGFDGAGRVDHEQLAGSGHESAQCGFGHGGTGPRGCLQDVQHAAGGGHTRGPHDTHVAPQHTHGVHEQLGHRHDHHEVPYGQSPGEALLHGDHRHEHHEDATGQLGHGAERPTAHIGRERCAQRGAGGGAVASGGLPARAEAGDHAQPGEVVDRGVRGGPGGVLRAVLAGGQRCGQAVRDERRHGSTHEHAHTQRPPDAQQDSAAGNDCCEFTDR